MKPERIGNVSFWYADIGGLPVKRSPLSCDTKADICIIGAGYTGLWTAYYLKKSDPGLKIVVVEKEFAGFGASGRNGGWLSGGFAWNHEKYLTGGNTPDDVRRMVRTMTGTVDEVIRVAEAEGIDADIRRTDELMVATNHAQMTRMLDEVEHRQSWGEGPDRVYAIGEGETRSRVNIPNAMGAMVVAGVARVQPAKLARGLAAVVEKLGVTIAEGTTVTSFGPGKVTTDKGTVTAKIVIRATEGFTATLPGLEREWLPLNSAQIATNPLPPEVWQKIGWNGHEILGDMANAYCYCQRTREGRITVGARGVPYRMGSKIDRMGEPDPVTVDRLVAILQKHFPEAARHGVAHAWCGVIGVPRDWCATVGFDPATGMGFAGGYVGVGVSTSNLSGRTLADLSLGKQTELTGLPWVNHRVRQWEPEPLRWLGVHGMYKLYGMADQQEKRPGAGPSNLAKLGGWITGRR